MKISVHADVPLVLAVMETTTNGQHSYIITVYLAHENGMHSVEFSEIVGQYHFDGVSIIEAVRSVLAELLQLIEGYE